MPPATVSGPRILGVHSYFGPWDDPQAALELYYKERSTWEAGRNPRQEAARDGHQLTVGQMVALTLDAKEDLMATGELKPRTYLEYKTVGARMMRVWGDRTPVVALTPADFAKLKRSFVEGQPDSKGSRRGHRVCSRRNWCVSSELVGCCRGETWGGAR
jgi:hypothetical protein